MSRGYGRTHRHVLDVLAYWQYETNEGSPRRPDLLSCRSFLSYSQPTTTSPIVLAAAVLHAS